MAKKLIETVDITPTASGCAHIKQIAVNSIEEHRQKLKDLVLLVNAVELIDLGERNASMHNLLEEMAAMMQSVHDERRHDEDRTE